MYPNVVEINLAYVAMAAFPAAVIGGLDSGLGAVVAGFALGILEQLASYYVEPHLGSFGPGFAQVFPYVVMILFLVVRPYGLFGARDVERI
jgi:branched-chain amino acid transport system permease protein